MRIILWMHIILFGWSLQASAKSRLRHTTHRTFHRGHIKRVRVAFVDPHILFSWRAPSGKVIHYKGRQVPPGLKAKLKRYQKQGHTTLAVGGRYTFIHGNKGTVRPELAYAIRRSWTGLRVAKLDGVMPLFTATILPQRSHQTGHVYEWRGIVHSKLTLRDNKLICVYGTWFDLLDSKRRLVSPIRGPRGRSLFFFKPHYRTPRSWRALRNPKAKWRAYQAEKKRKAQKRPAIRKQKHLPTLSAKRYAHYYGICEARLSNFEKKRNAAPPVYNKPRSLPRIAPSKKR